MAKYCHLALLLFLICQTSELAFAVASPKERTTLFSGNDIASWMKPSAGSATHRFHAPFLFGVEGGIVATAAALYNGSENNNKLFLLSKFSTDGSQVWNNNTGSEVTTDEEGSGEEAAATGPQFPLRVIALVEGHGENVAGTPSGTFGYVTMIERGEDPSEGLQTLPMLRNSSIAYEVAGESLRRYRASASAAIVTETHRLVVPFE
ncbi:uncharacterized protein Tco025E_09932, partial [Trypanosoma conorhini]